MNVGQIKGTYGYVLILGDGKAGRVMRYAI